MVRLGNNDLEGVLEAVRVLAASRDPDEFSRAVIKQIIHLIPSDVVTINEVDPTSGRTAYMTEPESFSVPSEIEGYLGSMAEQHPLIHHFISTGDSSAKRISDFWTQEDFHASPIYQLLYGPLGVEYQLAIALPAPRPIVVGVALSRGDADFSERDRAVLNVLRPHLVQSWFNAKEQGHLRSLMNAASHATSDSGAGLILLSDPPHEVTPGALVSLYRFFGRPSFDSPLPGRVERWVSSQELRLDGTGPLELLKPLRGEVDGRRVLLRYLPGRGSHPGALLIRDERRSPKGHRLDALGLTPREAEIVGHVIRGDTNRAIGEALRVSPATIKKHLDNIYVKLGVRGRGRLTAFVVDVLER